MTMRKKLLITIACLSCILCIMVTGTIAWLIDSTDTITNTFTPSNITVSLVEENKGVDYKFQMIPGKEYKKDPTITVTTDIPCYVFVKVEEVFESVSYTERGTTKTAAFTDFLSYTIATGWTPLVDVNGDGYSDDGVYYREGVSGTPVSVLAGDTIQVKGSVTKAMMEALIAAGTTKYPSLKFTAYACQKEGFADAAAAWAEINP